ncbi:uncharacterized protein LOC111271434 [Varroa jacobsoni]|uniref:uncharacterized protein LOC111271434 n=1 Tax=Varroa jacobsoni TaxID=62625 RepID=UPI000BF46A41|nr:uncharacterized protein LOC111271434 [Varroa jacobsoni]
MKSFLNSSALLLLTSLLLLLTIKFASAAVTKARLESVGREDPSSTVTGKTRPSKSRSGEDWNVSEHPLDFNTIHDSVRASIREIQQNLTAKNNASQSHLTEYRSATVQACQISVFYDCAHVFIRRDELQSYFTVKASTLSECQFKWAECTSDKFMDCLRKGKGCQNAATMSSPTTKTAVY